MSSYSKVSKLFRTLLSYGSIQLESPRISSDCHSGTAQGTLPIIVRENCNFSASFQAQTVPRIAQKLPERESGSRDELSHTVLSIVFYQQPNSRGLMPHHRYKLPDLTYAYNALIPTISEEIMRLHHDKHHLAYVNGANAALDKLQKARETGFAGVDVKAIERDLAFHGSGHTMHSNFWPNMKPNGGGNPARKIADQINTDFGKWDSFKEQFSTAAKQVEGSGWSVLAYEPWTQQLITLQAEKHNDLTVQGVVPILVLDVWEHAYYLQYKNDRAAYVDAWWNVVNWDDVEKRLEKARR